MLCIVTGWCKQTQSLGQVSDFNKNSKAGFEIKPKFCQISGMNGRVSDTFLLKQWQYNWPQEWLASEV